MNISEDSKCFFENCNLGKFYSLLMSRPFILLLISCVSIFGTSAAQTKEQLDSLRNEFLKVLKNTPPPPDSVIRMMNEPIVPDTVLYYSNVPAYKVQAFPSIFETAYFKGTNMIEDSTRIDFYAVDIGTIRIESGKIIAGDPIVVRDLRAFVQKFPKGKFPVQLAIAKFNTDERVAYSRICFSQAPVVRWEFALDSGQKQMPIGGKEIYGYGVDGGIGLFIDARANQAFSELSSKDAYLWEKVFTRDMRRHYRNTWEYSLYEFDGHNLATFSTGMGDGHYATYVGYDASGRPCRLLTDFALIDWWKK